MMMNELYRNLQNHSSKTTRYTYEKGQYHHYVPFRQFVQKMSQRTQHICDKKLGLHLVSSKHANITISWIGAKNNRQENPAGLYSND